MEWKRKRTFLALACAWTLIVTEGREARAEPRPLVERAYGTTQMVVEQDPGDGGTAQPRIVIPLQLGKDVSAKDLAPQLRSVSTSGVERPELWSYFKPGIVNHPSGMVTLEIKVDLGHVRKPGNYELTVHWVEQEGGEKVGAADAGVRASEELIVHAIVPKASVRSIPPLIFEQSLSLVAENHSLQPESLPLREMGGARPLAPVAIEQIDHAVHGDAPVIARVIAKVPARVSSDAPVEATFEAKGTFPAGTSRGNLELRAPQLEDVVQIPFEVRARYPSGWIIPWFLVAGLLGWLCRVYLRNREQVQALRLQGLRLVRQARDEVARNDTDEGADLREALRTLEQTLSSHTLDQLDPQTKALNEALTRAQGARRNAEAALLAEVSTLLVATDTTWHLPQTVVLAPLRAALALARKQALGGDFESARESVREAEKALRKVRDDVLSWANDLDEARSFWYREGNGVPGDLQKALAPELAALGTALDATRQAVESEAGFGQELRSVHTTLFQAERTSGRLRKEFQFLVDEVATAGMPSDLRPALVALASPERLVGTEPTKLLQVLQSAFVELRNLVQKPLGKRATDDEIRPLFEAGKYVQAMKKAEELAAASAAIPGMQALTISDSTSQQPATSRAMEPAEAPANVVIPADVQVRPMMEAPLQAPVEVLAVQAMKELARERIFLGALTATIASLLAWAAYRETWVGSTGDWISLGTLGFTSEFTIESLLQSLGKGKDPPAR